MNCPKCQLLTFFDSPHRCSYDLLTAELHKIGVMPVPTDVDATLRWVAGCERQSCEKLSWLFRLCFDAGAASVLGRGRPA